MILRRIALLALKETWHILRDFRTLLLALGIPLVMLLLFGYALTMDVENIPMMVVDRDGTERSRTLIGAFERTGAFRIVERLDNPEEAEERFKRFRAKVLLVVPENFSRRVDRGEKAQAQLIVDGTDANTAMIATGYAGMVGQALTLSWSGEILARRTGADPRALAPPLTVKTRNWFNPALKSQWYLVPGLIAVIMAMMTSLLMALTVSREWERGTMEQLLVTPVSPLEIVLGKLIPYFVIGLMQLVLIAGSGILLFKVPLKGNLGWLFAFSSLFLVGGLSQGLLISVLARSQQLAMMLSTLTSMLPAMLLSGFMTPIHSMPPLIQKITYIFPARYFLTILRGLFLKDSLFEAIRPEVTALAVYALLMILLCALRFRTKVA